MAAIFPIIVNYRTGPMVVECLSSLLTQRQALRGGRVIVVDNASPDDSLLFISAAVVDRNWQNWVDVIAMSHNGGFAYGNNAGIRRVREFDPQFHAVILLNPDTVVGAGSLDHLIAVLEANPRIGIAGPSIVNAEGRPEPSVHRNPSTIGELESGAQLGVLSRLLAERRSGSERQCDWLSGACLLIRREVIDEIGDLDEGYFLYFEEVDFCVRARRFGWHCAFVPEACVMHHEGASTGIRARGRRRPRYWFDSRRRFFVKHHGVRGLIAADVLWAIGRSTLAGRRALGFGGRASQSSEPAHLTGDLLFGDCKALISGSLRGIKRNS